MTPARIPFTSLASPPEEAEAIRRAIDRVIASGRFILGPELEAFEAEFAAACGVKDAIGVGNGTDAIALVLGDLDPEDEVITTPLSAAFTALAITMSGGTPVFADIDPVRLTMDPESVARLITPKTKFLLPVHLYGQPADMTPLLTLATDHNILIIEDCCQAHLATSEGDPVGTIGEYGAFSFYPTKNLGAYGDAGAIVTDLGDPTAQVLRERRNGGQTDRYNHWWPASRNTRLDEMQAAILRAKLPGLAAATARRRSLARLYRQLLQDSPVAVPPECDPGHVYHLFVVRSRRRDALQAHLKARGIETLIHYPVPIHHMEAFHTSRGFNCDVANAVCDELLSLPLYPSLTEDDVARVAAAIKDFN